MFGIYIYRVVYTYIYIYMPFFVKNTYSNNYFSTAFSISHCIYYLSAFFPLTFSPFFYNISYATYSTFFCILLRIMYIHIHTLCQQTLYLFSFIIFSAFSAFFLSLPQAKSVEYVHSIFIYNLKSCSAIIGQYSRAHLLLA